MTEIEFIKKNVDVLSRKEIAHRLNCTPSKISRLIKENRIDFDAEIVKKRKGFTFSKNSEKRSKMYAKRKRVVGRV